MLGHKNDLAPERYFVLAYGLAGALTLGITCFILFNESPSTEKSLRS